MIKIILFAALLASLPYTAHAEFLQSTTTQFADSSNDKGTLEERRTQYVDMNKINGRKCPERPYRPGWVMVHEDKAPSSYSHIGMALYKLRKAEGIKEAGTCNCELFIPEWEPLRAEYEEILKTVPTGKSAYEKELELTDRADTGWNEVSSLCRGVQ